MVHTSGILVVQTSCSLVVKTSCMTVKTVVAVSAATLRPRRTAVKLPIPPEMLNHAGGHLVAKTILVVSGMAINAMFPTSVGNAALSLPPSECTASAVPIPSQRQALAQYPAGPRRDIRWGTNPPDESHGLMRRQHHHALARRGVMRIEVKVRL